MSAVSVDASKNVSKEKKLVNKYSAGPKAHRMLRLRTELHIFICEIIPKCVKFSF